MNKLQLKVFRETGVILTGIGVYSYNTSNAEAAEIRNAVQKTILSNEWALQMHGFYADTVNKTLRFDVVLSFDIESEEALGIMQKQVQDLYPEYEITIFPDVDVTDWREGAPSEQNPDAAGSPFVKNEIDRGLTEASM